MSGAFKVEDTAALRDTMRGQCLGQAWWSGLVSDLLADTKCAARNVQELEQQRNDLLTSVAQMRSERDAARLALEAMRSRPCETEMVRLDGMWQVLVRQRDDAKRDAAELRDQATRWRCWLGRIREQAAATLENGSGFCATCSMTRPGMDALRIVYAQADDALRGEKP